MHADLLPHQSIYFSTVSYGQPTPVFDRSEETAEVDFQNKDLTILLVSGIAEPAPLIAKLSETYQKVIPVSFPDHYTFTQTDLDKVIQQYHEIAGTNKIILTTEKDAARLLPFNTEENIPGDWYYLPIEIKFLFNETEPFNHHILHYVKNNNKNSILYKK